jgi:hypothetical protein
MPSLYSATLPEFAATASSSILGVLTSGLAREGFDTSVQTTLSWEEQVAHLQVALSHLIADLPSSRNWTILLEYILPVLHKRLERVLLSDSVIYVIEYKGGQSTTSRAALQQAQDYCLNLCDFHEASRGQVVIPIAVGRFKTAIPADMTSYRSGVALSTVELSGSIRALDAKWSRHGVSIDATAWEHSRYFPVPTIIEAATSIYRNHDVKEIAQSRAGSDDLETTQNCIARAVADARERGVKKLMIVTGVPGAGKTLAGLNVVQRITQELDLLSQQAAFLSGNGPLVKVLQAALIRDAGRKAGASRSVRSRIREIHRFVRDTYVDKRPPADRMIVFDEAQRAWTAVRNLRKFEFDVSEPDMLLEVMGRHEGWSVIVALVGGGQEIHGGEAGLAAWGDALANHPQWEIVTSPEALDGGPAVAGSRLFRAETPSDVSILRNSDLHLNVSKRSYETEVTAPWVNAVLNGEPEKAADLAKSGLPVWMVRDLSIAREWLRARAKGHRRAGLVASSGATRIRADGVEPPTFKFLGGIDIVKWFLEPATDYRSSNQLEVALSEFELQGLELDLVGLLWGGDLIFRGSAVIPRKLSGCNGWSLAVRVIHRLQRMILKHVSKTNIEFFSRASGRKWWSSSPKGRKEIQRACPKTSIVCIII